MLQIWHLSAINLKNKTLVHGVLVRGTPPLHGNPLGSIKNLLGVLRSYLISVAANITINIEANGIMKSINTDINGEFWLEFDFIECTNILIYLDNSDTPIEVIQNYPIYSEEQKGRFEVISDIDDTVIVSYSARFLKRIRTVALNSPFKRKSIEFTLKLFKELEIQENRIFYVSKSESNLFGMISSFFRINQLPAGAIFLTPYLSLLQLFKSKKGKNYKEGRIGYLIESTDKQIILVGDDGQKDMEVFSKIFKKFPNRISVVYIRQTNSILSKIQNRNCGLLKDLGANIIYFKDDDTFASDTLLL